MSFFKFIEIDNYKLLEIYKENYMINVGTVQKKKNQLQDPNL